MTISLIVAISRNHVIGKDNQLPWHLPADLAHFKAITMGKPIVMGRKTHESIGKPLPGRQNVIISHDKNYYAQGCSVFHSIDDALRALQDETEIMIIGGATLFSQTLSMADQLYLTVIDADIDGDTFFPPLDQTQWQLIKEEAHLPDQKNSYSYCFQFWIRKK